MTDEEKLDVTIRAFENKLSSITTWADLKTMISEITKDKVKTFIKANLQQHSQNQTDAATVFATQASEVNDLITEVDNIL